MDQAEETQKDQAEEGKKKTQEGGEQAAYEKTRGEKVKNFCN